MKISVVGTGYVGLVSGTCMAESGITATCVDIDNDKIAKLKEGIIPIYEPGLSELVLANIAKDRLRFTTNLKESIENCDALFIAVGTPPGEDGSADLTYVLEVAREVGQYLNDYIVVLTKSTVPIGTSHKVKAAIQEELDKRGVDIAFDVASNPEFLKEGSAVKDFMEPDRIVVGTESDRAAKVIERLYYPFVQKGFQLIYMDIPSAEMTKYAANAMLATRISFMNDIASLCEKVGADVDVVRQGIGSDPRIGKKFLFPGCGYGGSCFPKDVKALVKIGSEFEHEMGVLKAVEEVNDRQKHVIGKKILDYFNGDVKGKRFALWGLSFKPQTDDMREAPSLVVIDDLIDAGAEIVAYDPIAMDETRHIIGDKITYAQDQYAALTDADALIVVTEWPEFLVPKFTYVERELKNKVIFDGRNIYDPSQMEEFGYDYISIGR